MCTSIIYNGKKTIAGFNLDILNMEYKVESNDNGVYIEILDSKEGWLPLFGANKSGDFVTMPTCYPYYEESDMKGKGDKNIINLNIDLLLEKKSFNETKDIVNKEKICSVKGITFQAMLTDKYGNVLKITPGLGYKYIEKPKYSVMTNFSEFAQNDDIHPWQGRDRYEKAKSLLSSYEGDFDVDDCFKILKETSQILCPTVVSIVYDKTANTVYWCLDREYENVYKKSFNLF